MRKLDECRERCAVALGNFDGLHRAHMKIINSCIEYSKENGLKSGVLLFDRHTSEVFGKNARLLTSMEEKLDILEAAGVDFVNIMHFDEVVAKTESEKFIEDILEAFNVSAFFAGYDYSFGRNAGGNAEKLKEYGEKKGFDAFIIECVKDEEKIISSTAIRELVENGNLRRAKNLLGRNYFLTGEVVRGYGNGTRTLFPTANVELKKNKVLPPDGVYAGITHIDGKKYKSAVNIGKNPTFNAKERTLESYILGFDGMLYGKCVTVEFIERIRGDKKFADIGELKTQIERDIEKVKKIKLK